MKTQLLSKAVCVVVLLTVSAAVAQTSPGDVLVNIPFSFVVANHQMQPGRYMVKPAASGVIRILDTDTKNSLFVSVHGVQSNGPNDAKLVFHRYGDSYFLAEVWPGYSDTGKELPKSKAEKEIASGKISGTRPRSEIAVLRPGR